MSVTRRVLALALTAVTALAMVGCGGTADSGTTSGSSPTGDATGTGAAAAVAADDPIAFARAPWPGLTVKTEIASQIFEAIGYDTNTTELSVPTAASGLSAGDAHVWLGNWWPSQENTFQGYFDDGSIEVLTTNLGGTTYRPAVPAYVAEDMGITSFADLAENSERFDGRFLGIEAGSPGNTYIQDAIDQDAYGLGDWELVTSSTSAMLTEVERRIDNDQAVAFLGWKPHWMTVAWDLHFLEDPQDVWPGAGEVRTVANTEWADAHPNATRLLEQLEVDLQTQSQWILEFGRRDRPADEVATEWITANQDVVTGWLEGVSTADGEPAADAVAAAFGDA